MIKCIIVDDEQFVRDGLERIICNISDIQVAAKCCNGLEVIQYLKNHFVDLVFADIRMPGMDGLELTRWLSINRSECCVVIVSAYADFEYAQCAMECGASYFLKKPVRAVRVEDVICQFLEKRNQKEKRLLWYNDIKRQSEAMDYYLEQLKKAASGEYSEKKLLYVEYEIELKAAEDISWNEELLGVGLTNILWWCAPKCVIVRRDGEKGRYCFVLLAEEQPYCPEAEKVAARIKELIGIEAEIYVRVSDIKDIVISAAEDQVIINAKEYIVKNLSSDISRSDVANAVHMSSSYFSKYFKRMTGMSFQEYLFEARIEKAKDMINKGCKVTDAAREAGFRNRSNFYQVFKDKVGCNPTEYKRKRESQK